MLDSDEPYPRIATPTNWKCSASSAFARAGKGPWRCVDQDVGGRGGGSRVRFPGTLIIRKRYKALKLSRGTVVEFVVVETECDYAELGYNFKEGGVTERRELMRRPRTH